LRIKREKEKDEKVGEVSCSFYKDQVISFQQHASGFQHCFSSCFVHSSNEIIFLICHFQLESFGRKKKKENKLKVLVYELTHSEYMHMYSVFFYYSLTIISHSSTNEFQGT